jgi:hypothetical protein
MIWAGTIGQVREVHCWTDRAKGWWAQGVQRPPGSDPVPAYLDWDKWLGPAPMRPYLHEWPNNLQTRLGKNVYHPASGAVGGILAAAPWATWPATSWIVRKWR